MKLHLMFAETALELVPPEVKRHPSVRRNAKRQGKRPEETLLDRSLHHFAMDRLPNSEKRGRPDIIHFCLLEAMGSPLNRAGLLRVWVNTINGLMVEIDPSTRPPRDYNRFKSLMEQLLINGRAPSEGERPLFVVRNVEMKKLVEEIKPTHVIALTSHGTPGSFKGVGETLAIEESPMVLIGAYSTGAMNDDTMAVADQRVSVYPESLEAWTVTSRILYETERASGLHESVSKL